MIGAANEIIIDLPIKVLNQKSTNYREELFDISVVLLIPASVAYVAQHTLTVLPYLNESSAGLSTVTLKSVRYCFRRKTYSFAILNVSVQQAKRQIKQFKAGRIINY